MVMETSQVKCRGCLKTEPFMYNSLTSLETNLNLAKLVYETTSIEIKDNYSFFCQKCAQAIVDFYNFKLQFIFNQKHFCLEKQIAQTQENTHKVTQSEKTIELEHDYTNKNIKVEHNDNSEDYFSIGEKIKVEKETFLNCPSKIDTGQEDVESSKNNNIEKIESEQPKVVLICCKTCDKELCTENDFLEHANCNNKSKVRCNDTIKTVTEKCNKKDIKPYKIAKDDDYVKCGRCNTVVRKKEYSSHMEIHKKYVCFCGVKYATSNLLKDHKNSTHSEDRNFICHFCGKTFKIKRQLQLHTRFIHINPGGHVCETCGQRFNKRGTLTTHIFLKHHPKREFQCNICGLQFPLKSTLDKHLRRHNINREKRFTCSECNLKFYEKYSLTRHMLSKHSNDLEKVPCEYCDKTFVNKGNLNHHMKKLHPEVIIK